MTPADYARDALYGHSAFSGGTLQAVEAAIAAAEERGRRAGSEAMQLGTCRVYTHGCADGRAASEARPNWREYALPHPKRENCTDWVALAPRDPGINAKVGRSDDGLPVVNFDRDALHAKGSQMTPPDSSEVRLQMALAVFSDMANPQRGMAEADAETRAHWLQSCARHALVKLSDAAPVDFSLIRNDLAQRILAALINDYVEAEDEGWTAIAKDRRALASELRAAVERKP